MKARSFSPPLPPSKAEWLASIIEQRITDEALPAGTLLGTRDQLKASFDVAPSTVTEAIRLLADRGLVVTRTGPGGGVFVTEMRAMVRLGRTIMDVSDGPDEVSDALEVRAQLEPAVIVGAAQREPSTDLTALKDAFASMESAESFADFYRCTLDFHVEVARLCTNEILRGFYLSTVEVVRHHDPRLRPRPGEDPTEMRSDRIGVHRAVLDAIEARDVKAATRASAAHAKGGHARISIAR